MLRPDCAQTFCAIGLVLVSNNVQVSIITTLYAAVIKCHFKTTPVYYVGLGVAEHTEFVARKTAGRMPARFANVGVWSEIRESS